MTTKHILTLLGGIAFGSITHADVTIADYNGPGDFSFNVNFMTDLDQRRSGLPNSGSAFATPTTTLNLMTYAANFGFPNLYPGPGLWEGEDRHDEMTGYIFSLANSMGTDWDDGTDLLSAHNVLKDIADNEGLSVVTFFAEGDYWPLIDDAADWASSGAVVNFGYGRWEAFTFPPTDLKIIEHRVGGHQVTLQRAFADNGDVYGPREIRYRDPLSSDSVNTNSNFASTDMPTAENVIFTRGNDLGQLIEHYPITSLINPPPADGRYRLVDSFMSLRPQGAIGFSQILVSVQFVNGHIGFSPGSAVPYDAPQGSTIVDMVPHPEMHSTIVLLESLQGQKTLMQLPHEQQRAIHLTDLPASTHRLALGYGHTMVALTDTSILRLRVHSESAQRVETLPYPTFSSGETFHPMAVCGDGGSIILLDGDLGVVEIDADTLELAATYKIKNPFRRTQPRDLTVMHGHIMIALDNGQLLEARLPNKRTRWEARRNSFRTLPGRVLNLRGVRDALSVDMDDGGRLFVSDARRGLLEFEELRHRGWQPARQPRFEARNFLGRKVAVLKSRTNYRPEIHGTRGWLNIPAEELLPLGPEIED